MQDGLFFRVLRRFNIVMCTLLALLLLGGLGLAGWKFATEGSLGFYPVLMPSIQMPKELVQKVEYNVSLANFDSPGLDQAVNRYGLFVLNRSQGPEYYGAGEAVNVMQIDDDTADGHWAFKGVNRIITMRDAIRKGLPDASAAVDARPVTGLMMWVQDYDVAKDGARTPKAGVSFYHWALGKTDAVKLLTVQEGLASGQIGSDRYSIVYRKDGKIISAMYALPDFKLITEKTLSDPSK